MRVLVLADSEWGCALAVRLAARHEVSVWGRSIEKLLFLERHRQHPAWAEKDALRFPPNTFFFTEKVLPSPPDIVLLASNMAGLTAVCRDWSDKIPAHVPLVLLCKGLSADKGKWSYQVVEQVYAEKNLAIPPLVILTGPSFAKEVSRGQLFALTAASKDTAAAALVQELCVSNTLRVYTTHDIIGACVGGAVKNVLAVATGISDGIGQGYNARAALLTRGLAEMLRLGISLGAQSETIYGLSGLGDLILTATSDLSRNRRVGLQLAQGHSLDLIEQTLGSSLEGVHSVRQLLALSKTQGIEMPITQTVYEVLFEGLSAQKAMSQLMERSPKQE